MNFFQQKTWRPGFAQVSALFFPIMPYGEVFSKFDHWPSVEKLNLYKPSHVQTFGGIPLSFVEQKGQRQKYGGINGIDYLYEPRIFIKGEVSTRAQSWHDFFNAMIWYAFPCTKSALNMRQFIAYDERAAFPWREGLKTRTREQDLMAMFDEGGCILIHTSFVHPNTKEHLELKIPFLFGHGFYEMIAFGKSDLSACALEVTLFESFLQFSSKEMLRVLDEKVASLVSNREYYKMPGAFRSVKLEQLHAYLRESEEILHAVLETKLSNVI